MRNTPKISGRNKKGFTFIELVVAMAVSAILGVILVTTLQTGIVSYKNISYDMITETEARAALSLITVQIRQHDQTGAIRVLGETSLQFIDDPDLPNSSYSVVTYESGKLVSRQYDDLSDVSGIALSTVEVAAVSAFSVTTGADTFGAPVYLISIGYGEGKTLKQSVTQRSAQGVT